MRVYPLDHELTKPYILRINKIKEPFPTHRHNFLEFSYIIDGSGIEIINGKKHKLEKGTFTLLLPYQVHEIHPDKNKELILYNCNLSMEIFFGQNKLSEELNEMIFNINGGLPSYVFFKKSESFKIESILKNMLNEYKDELLWKDLLFRSKIIELFILFNRYRRESVNLNKNKKNLLKSQKNTITKSYLWEVIFYIHKHYMEDIGLEKLARHFGISSAHLSTTFKEYFGENIHSFLNDLRIKHACGLLASSNKQIIDIANEVGFNSYATFSRVFRQKQGISASEYKSKIQ